MKNLCAFVISVLVLALVGCGGSGGGETVPAEPAVAPVAAAEPDCRVASVPTDAARATYPPGARDIEALAFRFEGNCGPYEQFVYGSRTATELSKIFRNVRLAWGGSDVNLEAQYSIEFDDKAGRVIQDFNYQWAPAGTVGVPRTYSFLVDARTDVKAKTSVAMDLVGIQSHRYGAEPKFDVKGRILTFEPIPGMELPVVTTSSPATFIASEIGGKAVPVGDIKISCSKENKEACYLETAKFHACDLGNPMLKSDQGYFYWAGRGYYPDDFDTYRSEGIELAIQPGETKTVTFFGTPEYADVRLSVVDIVMRLGDSVRVTPIITAVPGSNSLLIPDTKECPQRKG